MQKTKGRKSRAVPVLNLCAVLIFTVALRLIPGSHGLQQGLRKMAAGVYLFRPLLCRFYFLCGIN